MTFKYLLILAVLAAFCAGCKVESEKSSSTRSAKECGPQVKESLESFTEECLNNNSKGACKQEGNRFLMQHKGINCYVTTKASINETKKEIYNSNTIMSFARKADKYKCAPEQIKGFAKIKRACKKNIEAKVCKEAGRNFLAEKDNEKINCITRRKQKDTVTGRSSVLPMTITVEEILAITGPLEEPKKETDKKKEKDPKVDQVVEYLGDDNIDSYLQTEDNGCSDEYCGHGPEDVYSNVVSTVDDEGPEADE